MIQQNWNKKIRTLLLISITSLILAMSGALSAFYPIEASIILNILFPIFVMLYIRMETTFGYIKLTTLVLGRLLIVLAVWEIGVQSIHWVCLLLLQINILEAIILDLSKQKIWNALSGVLLLVSSVFFISLSWTGAYVLIEFDNFLPWILAYTIWNGMFVVFNLEQSYYLGHLTILIAPLLFCSILNDYSYWLVLRETTLTLGISIMASYRRSFKSIVSKYFDIKQLEKLQSRLAHNNAQILFFGINVILIGLLSMNSYF